MNEEDWKWHAKKASKHLEAAMAAKTKEEFHSEMAGHHANMVHAHTIIGMIKGVPDDLMSAHSDAARHHVDRLKYHSDLKRS